MLAFFARRPASRTTTRPDTRARLGNGFETLEDRTAPAAHSAITTNFNAAAIPAGDYLWFNSTINASKLPANHATTVHVANQSVTFSVNGTTTTVAVPDAAVTFDPSAKVTASTTAFSNGAWATSTSGLNSSGNVFLSGEPFAVPAGGIPGGVRNVTWQGDFWADSAGVKVTWAWSAAAYNLFSADPTILGVKSNDHSTTQFNNTDHAGTPETYKADVARGGKGRGGVNYTGNLTRTSTVSTDQTPPVTQPPPVATANLSGTVRDVFGNPVGGLTVTLAGTNSQGQPVSLTTTTAADGTYTFAGVDSGTYTLSIDLTNTSFAGPPVPTVGSQGGQPMGDGSVSGIVMNGTDASGYNFTLSPLG
jgi:hypothetical protein